MMQMPANLIVYLYSSSRDNSVVSEVYQKLKKESWINPWLDSAEVIRGSGMLSADLQSDTAMFSAHVIMVFASGSLDYQKVFDMLNMGKPLLILRLDDTGLPFALTSLQSINFFPAAKRADIYTRTVLDYLKRQAASFGISISGRSQFQDVDHSGTPPAYKTTAAPRKAIDEPTTGRGFGAANPSAGKPAQSRKPATRPVVSSKQVFISYSRRDAEFANRINADLNTKGITTWIDRVGIRKGEQWPDRIAVAIEDSAAVLMLVSASAFESTWVRDEVSFAHRKKKEIFPLILEDCEHPGWFEIRFGTTDWTDFTKGKYKDNFDDLLRALQVVLGS